MSTTIFSTFLLFLAMKSIVADGTSEYDSTYYEVKTKAVHPKSLGVENANPFKMISFYGGNCNCANLACSCCTGVRVKKANFDRQVCAALSYLSQEFGIKAAINVNNRQVLSTSVSARNPPAICVKVPDVPAVQLCLRFHDITISGSNLNFCTDLETHVTKLPVLKLQFNCVQI